MMIDSGLGRLRMAPLGTPEPTDDWPDGWARLASDATLWITTGSGSWTVHRGTVQIQPYAVDQHGWDMLGTLALDRIWIMLGWEEHDGSQRIILRRAQLWAPADDGAARYYLDFDPRDLVVAGPLPPDPGEPTDLDRLETTR